MSLKFCANLSMLWAGLPLEERLDRAAQAGFGAVEMWWPGIEQAQRLPEWTRAAGVQLVGLNFDAGDMPAGDRGLLSDPDRTAQFRENVPVALEIAEACGCRQLNALLGLRLDGYSAAEQLELAGQNIAWAAGLAAASETTVLVEAVNTFDNGPYLITNTANAVAFVTDLGLPNVRLLYDVFHMQRMEGNLVATLERNWDLIAHIQVADSPLRGEPGTGEINYPFIFAFLERQRYEGYIGLEYRPTTERTEDSLGWMNSMEVQS